MKYNPEKHKRKSIRLKNYDYSKAGMYFITICAFNRENIFGLVENEKCILNEYGKIVNNIINELPIRFKNIIIDCYVIMPNHLHLIIKIINNEENVGVELALLKNIDSNDEGRASSAPTNISSIIQVLKSLSTIEINKSRQSLGLKVWQRNYYEHIIRNENELQGTRLYIEYNPLNWELDEFF